MQIPQDSAILLSFVNMKLRGDYSSPDDLCDDLEISREELDERLARAGYRYDETINQYR